MSGDASTILARFGLRVGDLVAGRYRIVDVLGAGGMGVVVGAVHSVVGTPYAVKLLRPESGAPGPLLERFLREARAGTRLTSPHAVRVFDVAPLPEGGAYILMERLDGADLKAVLRRAGPPPPAIAADWIAQACHAIEEANGLGIIHRDVRSRNLFLVERGPQAGTIKVLDFGIAKLLRDEAAGWAAPLTVPGSLLGYPHYMSPEQIVSARDADARADVWSLGVTLYELLVGRLPFVGADDSAVAFAVRMTSPSPPAEVRPGVPQATSDVVMRCLEKDRERRYASARDLRRALLDAVERGAMPAVVASVPAPAQSRRIAKPLLVVSAVAAIVGSVVSWTLAERRAPPTHPAAAWDETPVTPSSSVVELAPQGIDPMPSATASDLPPLLAKRVGDAPETTNVSCVLAQLACERRLPDCQTLLDDCTGNHSHGPDAGPSSH